VSVQADYFWFSLNCLFCWFLCTYHRHLIVACFAVGIRRMKFFAQLFLSGFAFALLRGCNCWRRRWRRTENYMVAAALICRPLNSRAGSNDSRRTVSESLCARARAWSLSAGAPWRQTFGECTNWFWADPHPSLRSVSLSLVVGPPVMAPGAISSALSRSVVTVIRIACRVHASRGDVCVAGVAPIMAHMYVCVTHSGCCFKRWFSFQRRKQ